MTTPLVECSFFLPVRRDANLSDGSLHSDSTWDWLDLELFTRFGGGTIAPGNYRGFYVDPDTKQKVDDESRRFIVAVPESETDRLRLFLQGVCVLFVQKCIYLSVAGRVEFVSPAGGPPP
jgi:hypothetical protein